jgi:hypothetical protein
MTTHRQPPRPGAAPEPRRLQIVIPPVRVPAPMPVIEDDFGDFRSWGGGKLRIPVRVIFEGPDLSLTGWKILLFLVMREHNADLTANVLETDLQVFLGRRITAANLRAEVRKLIAAGAIRSDGFWPGGLEFHLVGKFAVPRHEEEMRLHPYALVDLRHVRRFKKVAHLRMYLALRYQSRVSNNVRRITPEVARRWFGAPAGKKWGNVMQDSIAPAIDAVETIAGINVAIEIQRDNTRGRQVIGLRLTAGALTKFKDADHKKRYEIRMSRRNVSAETEKFFRRDLDAIMSNFNQDVDGLPGIKAAVKNRILADFYAECRVNGKPQRDGFHIVTPLLDEDRVKKALIDSIRESRYAYRDFAEESTKLMYARWRMDDEAERGRLFRDAEIPQIEIQHFALTDTETACGKPTSHIVFGLVTLERMRAGHKVTCHRCNVVIDALAK